MGILLDFNRVRRNSSKCFIENLRGEII